MSFSIDDLAASLSTSHIGQEALDLAALHAQLSQALFGQSIAHPSAVHQNPASSSCHTPPCNTPTFPSSFTLASQFGEPEQYSSVSYGFEASSCPARDEMEEDERMVEDLLIPRSPMNVSTTAFHFPASTSKPQFSSHQTSETASSSFASTDPFYVDLSQRHDASPRSVFAQLGRPAQQSPFALQASLQRREHTGAGHPAPHLSVDPHSHSFLLSTPSAAFDY